MLDFALEHLDLGGFKHPNLNQTAREREQKLTRETAPDVALRLIQVCIFARSVDDPDVEMRQKFFTLVLNGTGKIVSSCLHAQTMKRCREG
ncbi:MAG TPA: hypothetical protein VKE42_02080 [Candidatus Cybelea sp.]|nr:hypothetical protein [Candidatus Cybelea sp.]